MPAPETGTVSLRDFIPDFGEPGEFTRDEAKDRWGLDDVALLLWLEDAFKDEALYVEAWLDKKWVPASHGVIREAQSGLRGRKAGTGDDLLVSHLHDCMNLPYAQIGTLLEAGGRPHRLPHPLHKLAHHGRKVVDRHFDGKCPHPNPAWLKHAMNNLANTP